MEIIYRADDGKEFDNELACRDYEESLQAAAIKGVVHLWNEDRDPVAVNSDIFSNFDIVYYFRCDTEESYESIYNFLFDDGFSKGLLPCKGEGITWMWCEPSCKWQPVAEEIKVLQEGINQLMAMEGIER